MSSSLKPLAPNPRPIDAGVSIGHVHLKVVPLTKDGHLEMETRALDTRELSGELTP